MDYFTRSLLRPEHKEVDGKRKLEGKALDLDAFAKSSVILSKKLTEASKPPPAPRPKERLPPVKCNQDQCDSDCPSDTESIYSLPSQHSNASAHEGLGFPTILSCELNRLEERGGNVWSHGPEEDLLQAVLRYARW